MTYLILTMARSDFARVLDWAATEGWNPGKHDLETLLPTDPTGFFVGVLDGRPIASISAVAYDDHYGFVGYYIVRPDYRGQGYGLQIWNHGLAYLGERLIGLDGVTAQQHNYRKSGFEIATRIERFAGEVKLDGMARGSSAVQLAPASSVSLTRLCAFDRAYYPAGRELFLHRWIGQPEAAAWAALSQDGSLLGYGVIRPAVDAWRIGPLFARTADVARMLFVALAGHAKGEMLCIDVPEANPQGARLASDLGLEEVFSVARMYKGGTPDIDFTGMYGTTSLELG